MTKLLMPCPLARRRRVRRRLPWIIGLAVGSTVWLTACSPSILGTDPDTGLNILVTRGPIRPVAREGEDNSAPVQDALVRIRRTDGSGDTGVRTGADGVVVVPVVPGTYRVEVRECPGALALPDPISVTVVAGELATLAFDCDTGIR